MTRISMILWLSLIAALILPPPRVFAQQMPSVDGRQFMINQMTPPGTAAEWAMKSGRGTPEYFQPVKISLPTTGVVTFFEGPTNRAYDLPAPAQASLLVGRMYRLRISEIPEFPGVDFFPSIELIDRLHPPAGRVEDYPVDFELTVEEMGWAANGRLVTKVVYLEQPNRVPLTILDHDHERVKTIEPYQNVIAEADLLGRPMAIVRLGGRTPDPNRPDPVFFGPGGPIRITKQAAQNLSTALPVKSTLNATSPIGVVSLGPKASRRVAQR